MNILKKIFGTKSERDVKIMQPLVDDINAIYKTLEDKSDDDLVTRTSEMRNEIISAKAEANEEAKAKGLAIEEFNKVTLEAETAKLDEFLPEAFAIVKETCRRLMGESWRIVGQEITWEMIPYDVQLVGAIALHQGKVAEMKTGEGKTLAATMPLYLNALAGRGAHLITVNDYLAQRDAEWMGEIYKRLGLSVGYILNSMDNEARQAAYNCDITYGTNNEFGFDYLRDNMALSADEKVQRDHFYAIVDEVDSVLIDEARTPLIISGAVDAPTDTTSRDLKPLVQTLVKKQQTLVTELVQSAEKLLEEEKDDEAGLKLLQATRGMPKHKRLLKMFQEKGMQTLTQSIESAYMRDKKLHEVDEDLYFSIDEKSHVIDITDMGREALAPDNPEMFVIPDLGEMLLDIDENDSLDTSEKQQEKEQAHQLHAERSSKIHTISQLLRAFSLYEKDIEYVVQDGQVLIVDEFTGRILPGRRYSDGLHQAIEAKENVEIKRETQTLATITIQNYFRMFDKLSGMTGTAETEAEELGSIYNLDVMVIPPNEDIIRDDRDDLVYKTKREKYNAVIDEISNAHSSGQPTLVGTISVEASELLSRMLKRKGIPHNVLNAKQHKSEAEIVTRAGQPGAVTIATNMAGRGTDIKLGSGVKESGGLHILGTERHESRRIDDQLRGRSGRQGDPGSSRFYLSLEDDLMRLFNSERVASIMDKMGVEDGEVITHKMVTRAIGNAQKKVEQRNFGIRKHLLEYDDVMNQQRQVVYDLRNQALQGENLRETVLNLISDFIDDEFETQDFDNPRDWDWEHLKHIFSSVLMVDVNTDEIPPENENELNIDEIHQYIMDKAVSMYQARETIIPEDVMRNFERFVILRSIDEKWKDHLYGMDQLREGINLRAYGQKNPLLEYKSEGFQIFREMISSTSKITLQRLFRTQIQGVEQQPHVQQKSPRNVQLQHQDTTGMGMTAQPQQEQQANRPQQAQMTPIHSDKKIGRNEKIKLISPNGEEIEVKYKKLQDYLNKGYTQTV
ncbi:MAG: preprotein translocase subunit SecA [Candidatus Marinimicrobia bacterium]|nr:preprotein translocase subunit SecA [Candidatus Neomarinimicrobiota bacterium]MDP7512166.1 preprotein translocase subunit SecA [Candidatus Neomarinimicrobiota bacterium]